MNASTDTLTTLLQHGISISNECCHVGRAALRYKTNVNEVKMNSTRFYFTTPSPDFNERHQSPVEDNLHWLSRGLAYAEEIRSAIASEEQTAAAAAAEEETPSSVQGSVKTPPAFQFFRPSKPGERGMIQWGTFHAGDFDASCDWIRLVLYSLDVILIIHRLTLIYDRVNTMDAAHISASAKSRGLSGTLMTSLPLPSVHRCLESERQVKHVASARRWYRAALQSNYMYEKADVVTSSDHEFDTLSGTTSICNGGSVKVKPPHDDPQNQDARPVPCPLGIGYYSSSLIHSPLDGGALTGVRGDEGNVCCTPSCCWEKYSTSSMVSRLVSVAILVLLVFLVAKTANQARRSCIDIVLICSQCVSSSKHTHLLV